MSQGKIDGIYIRIGATNRKTDLETIVNLERQKRNISFDEEICLETPNINEKNDFLDIEIIRPIVTAIPMDTVGEPLRKESYTNDYGQLDEMESRL